MSSLIVCRTMCRVVCVTAGICKKRSIKNLLITSQTSWSSAKVIWKFPKFSPKILFGDRQEQMVLLEGEVEPRGWLPQDWIFSD